MTFAKFVSLIASSELYFARADTFLDPFEGAKGSTALESRYDNFYLSFLRDLNSKDPEGKSLGLTPEEIEVRARESLRSLRKAGDWARKTTFINCWHEAKQESEAMWRLYGGWDRGKEIGPGSVCVVSTFGKLKKCLGKHQSVYVGRVKYIDYSKHLVGLNEAFWHKSHSFEHEREVRAIAHRHKVSSVGIALIVDLNELISEVILTPTSPDWVRSTIESVISKYNWKFPVRRSSLEIEPFF